MYLEYIVSDNDEGKTVKEILISKFKISHNLLINLKRKNSIFLNNICVFANKTVAMNDIVKVCFNYEEDNSNIIPKKMNLDIVFEDDCILAVNKPAGITVHPSILHYEDSLSNGIAYYFNNIGLKKKIRPVNRIDKDTSGLVIFAKNEYVQENLIKQMQNGKFYKEYIAIVEGIFDNKKDTINLPISRKEGSIMERCINKNGDTAITHYEVINEFQLNNTKYSIIKCILETGRTHQIRVHLSYIGHPLLGDDLYGGKRNLINRQALHSYKIRFIHPITSQIIDLQACIPSDIKKLYIVKNDR